MYETLLFDLDGTLIDSAADIAASVNHVRGHYGLPPLPLTDVKHAIGDGLPVLLERTVPVKDPAAREVYFAHHEEHCLDETELYPGVREGLATLAAAGVAMAVVTNKPQRLSERVLAGLGVMEMFAAVVGGDTRFGRKPEPGQVIAVLEAFGRPTWNAVMVGDSRGDVAAGHAAATGTCVVAWGFRAVDEVMAAVPAPDHVAHGFADVVALALHEGRRKSVWEQLGSEAFVRLARAFYARVDVDARLRAMFPPRLEGPIERQAGFLIQFFGGPQDYSARRGHPRLRVRHAPFTVDRAARDAWVENMLAAMAELEVPEPARGIMRRYFEHTGSFLINA